MRDWGGGGGGGRGKSKERKGGKVERRKEDIEKSGMKDERKRRRGKGMSARGGERERGPRWRAVQKVFRA